MKTTNLTFTNGQSLSITNNHPVKVSTDLDRQETILVIKGLPVHESKSGDQSCN